MQQSDTQFSATPWPDTRFHLLVIGDEILSGRRQDKHMPFAISALGARGLQLASTQYVPDEREAITTALQAAFARAAQAQVTVCTGGIGSTPDDHTRQCAAAALGLPLVPQAEAQALIVERIQAIAQQQGIVVNMAEQAQQHRLNMGVLPAGCGLVPNRFNRIPGFYCVPGQSAAQPAPARPQAGVYFFPGFPEMAHPMLEWVLDTHYPHLHHRAAHTEKALRVLRAFESNLTQLMVELEADYAVRVFSLPSEQHPQFGRSIELGVKGERAMCEAAFSALQQRLAELGYETLLL